VGLAPFIRKAAANTIGNPMAYFFDLNIQFSDFHLAAGGIVF
jgi:hypothetical protein